MNVDPDEIDATIVILGAVIVGGWRGITKILKLVKSTNDQVANTHKTNFRDDVDALDDKVDKLNGKVAGVEAHVASISTAVVELSRRIDTLLTRGDKK